MERLAEARGGIENRLTEIVDTITDRLSEARLILTTVYDPSDGSGILPGTSDLVVVLAAECHRTGDTGGE